MPNPYKVSQLKEPGDVYYVYTCRKDEKMDNEKVLKRLFEEAKAKAIKANKGKKSTGIKKKKKPPAG